MKKRILLFTCLGLTVLLTACQAQNQGRRTGGNTAPSVKDVLEERMAEEDKAGSEENSQSLSESGSEDDFLKESEELKAMTEGVNLPGDTAERRTGVNEDAPAPEEEEENVVLSTTEGIDVDLTILSSTMVYSEVYNMLSMPEDYEGKIIRMHGTVGSYEDTATGNKYYGCIIQDATACCAQGIEFSLEKGYEYPADDEEVTVVGEFGTYEEEGFIYCTLKDAKLEE